MTLSPMRTTAAPCACLASLPVSKLMVFPPASSTITVCGSGFISLIPSTRRAPCVKEGLPEQDDGPERISTATRLRSPLPAGAAAHVGKTQHGRDTDGSYPATATC